MYVIECFSIVLICFLLFFIVPQFLYKKHKKHKRRRCKCENFDITPDCEIGYYCPNNTEKVLCEKGYYCPDSNTKKVCELGNYCPEGSSVQVPCPT